MRNKFVLIALITLALAPSLGQAQSPNHAGLVIQFPDGQVETACVEFSEEEITGVDLLNRSGLPVTFDYSSGLGAKVCKIKETGCNYPGEDCWCQCQGSPCTYWNYWQLRGDLWVYSPLGASDRRLGDGDVDGWVWGDGQQPPSLLSLDEICEVEVQPAKATIPAFTSPLDTPTVQPTATRPRSPTATSATSPLSLPTATSLVSPLALPAASPTSTPATQVFIPAASGEPAASKVPEADLPASSDRYVGFAGVLATLGLIALTVWRRRNGV